MISTRRVRRIAALGVVGSVSLALLLPQQMPVAAADPDATPVPSPQTSSAEEWLEPTGTGLVRPDWLSASVTARASGQRVEVLSERTASARQWIRPDGLVEAEMLAGEVRFEDAQGSETDGWRDIDTTLVPVGGGRLEPKAVPGEVSLSAGGAGDQLLTMTDADGGEVKLGSGLADVQLPEPVVQGSTARYVDVLPGVDLSVEVRSSGFEQLWVVKDEAGLQELVNAEAASGEVSLTAPMTLKDLQSKPQKDGSVAFTDLEGDQVGELGVPTMWDGEVDARTGEPVNVERVDFEVTANGADVGPTDPAKSGKLALTVNADQEWLADPDRVFPITIDPTYASASSAVTFDTFVQEGYTTDESSSNELKLGNNGSGQVARTYMNFSQAPFVDKKIMSARLGLFENWSWSCSKRGWSAYNAGTTSTATRWTSQPWNGTKYATSTETRGAGSSCPEGRVYIDMKTQLQLWADESATTRGLMLRADDESDPYGWKRFHSSEGSWKPKLEWTYNRAPAVSQAAQVDPIAWYNAMPYTATRTPKVTSAAGSDADNNTIRVTMAAFASQTAETGALATCDSSYVAPSSTVACTFTTALPSNSTVWLKSRSWDGFEYSRWTVGREVRVADVTPAAPVISCPAPYSNNSWQATAPSANVTCTITAAGSGFSAPSTIRWQVDNGAWTTTAITQSTSTATAKTTVSVPKALGGHRVAAHAVSPSGKQSTLATYSLGWGSASLKAPLNSPRQTTTDTVTVTASGPPKGTSTAPTAKIRWRVAGSTGSSGWVDAPASNTLAVSESGGATLATGLFGTASVVGLSDGAGVVVAERRPSLLEVQVCLAYTSGSQCTPGATVLRVPHAFGNNYPTQEAGPGQVALWTGELNLSDTDAALAAPGGEVSVSRSHSSFAGPAAPQNRVFGPGWTAAFDDGAGFGGEELVDGTAVDGTLALVDAEGGALVWTTPTAARRTAGALPTGTYVPADDDTAASGSMLKVTGTGASTVAEVTDEAGVVTKYQVVAAPATNQDAVFRTVSVTDKVLNDTTTYSYDAAGRVSAIVAPLPDGVTACTPGTKSDGCRVLRINYATTTTATTTTPGNYVGQINSIVAQVNTDTDRKLAEYKYDHTGRLVEAKDSRTGLTTTYGWTGTGPSLRLATLTPSGQDPFTFNYASDKLAKVTRPVPATAGGGTAQLAAFVYGVPVAGANLPDLPATTSLWNQTRTPTWGAATFGPDHVITSTSPTGISAEGWKRADLVYTDADGYTLNSAGWGAGDWQYTATDYDDQGNPVAQWDERGTRAVISEGVPSGAARDYATLTVYNDDIANTSGAVVTPAGTLVTDVYSPARMAVPASAAEAKLLRTHVKTSYDQGAPNNGYNPAADNQPYRLATKTVTTAETPDRSDSTVVDISFTGYAALVSGDKSGWELGQATTTTVDMDLSGSVNAGDITTATRYDDTGRVIENRQPKSDGTDAGTRRTTYYTAASSPVSACGNKPKMAGYTCQIGPAAQPPGQLLPVTTSTYTWDGQTATEAAISGPVTSTTTTTYDAHDRPTTITTAVTGLPGSKPVPPTTTSYDATTGEDTGTISTAGSTSRTYDSWGRELTYSNSPAGQPADTSTTTYNAIGQVVSVVDNNGETRYTYDGTDASGSPEYRGLVTKVETNLAGNSAVYASTGAYDHASDLVLETLPGQVIRRTTLNTVGEQTSLTYHGQATIDGNPVPDQPWFAWTTESDVESMVVREWTPLQDATAQLGADVTTFDREYTYDQMDRLITVRDRSTPLSLSTEIMPCTTRSYAFDANGNRSGQSTAAATSDGGCTTDGTDSISRSYDAADRLIQGANGAGTYVYDALGRQTIIPAVDAPRPDLGDITLSYYDGDAAHILKQGSITTTFALDGAGRRHSQTDAYSTGSNTLTRHYTDDGDNPTWSVDVRNGTATTTRYTELINGDLGLTFTTSGMEIDVQLELTSPRGDVVATADISSQRAATVGVTAWRDYTEYGDPTHTVDTTPGSTTGIGYGWLGSKQRATTDTGLILMGARLYNHSTGLFTSLDLIYGGNLTAYGYPVDPINKSDVTGEAFWIPLIAACIRFCYKAYKAVKWGYRAYKTYRSIKRPAQYVGRPLGYKSMRAILWATKSTRNARYVARTFDKGTFKNSVRSFSFHYAEHGKKWGSPARYAARSRHQLRKVAGSSKGIYKGHPGGRLNKQRTRWLTAW